jgi:hypothetical protein
MNRRSVLRYCTAVGVAIIVLAVGRWVCSAEQSGSAPIDWQHAKEIHQKAQQGQPLTEEEKAYLQRAMQAMASGHGPNSSGAGQQGGPSGGGIDWPKARELYQRSQQGKPLTDEEKAYLEKAKQVMQARGGGNPGARPAPPPATDHTGLVPLDQMTAGEKYKGEDGGLYGAGKNVPPPEQQKGAEKALKQVVPRGPDGKPAQNGKIVLISMGMSNTTQEFSKFKELADADPAKSPQLTIVDCAQGGQDAARWNDAELPAWRTALERIRLAGVTPEQVQVMWMKHARMGPAQFGEYPKHGQEMYEHIVKALHIAKEKFPNLQVVYLSSRIYAGYATTGLNPEPFAYESGLVVRRLIRDQIQGEPSLNCDPAKGKVQSPLLLWGPYLWADGITPRKSDGLVWNRGDLGPDGTHPSPASGREKVARLLLGFMKTDRNAHGWFSGR